MNINTIKEKLIALKNKLIEMIKKAKEKLVAFVTEHKTMAVVTGIALVTAAIKFHAAHVSTWYMEGYSKYADGTVIYDYEVADHVKKHLHFVDRFDIRKVVSAALLSHCLLDGSVEEPEGNWKYGDPSASYESALST